MKKIEKLLMVICAAILIIGCLPLCSVSAETEGLFEYYITNDGACISKATSEIKGVLIIPDSLGGKPVVKILSDAFIGHRNLSSVIIPESVTQIMGWAFSSTGLTNVTIPSTVEHIGVGAFSDCRSLVSINVEDENPNYTSIDGVLFTKDLFELLQYPAAKEGSSYTIPNEVELIHNSAFVSNQHLNEVFVSNQVTTICESAFLECLNLKDVYIPANVTCIETLALGYGLDHSDFGTPYKLSDVVIHCYAGTAAEQYAYECGFNSVILNKQGDLNGNDGIDTEDALVALKLVVNKVVATPGLTEIADVDGDGAVTAADALEMLKNVVGKISCF